MKNTNAAPHVINPVDADPVSTGLTKSDVLLAAIVENIRRRKLFLQASEALRNYNTQLWEMKSYHSPPHFDFIVYCSV